MNTPVDPEQLYSKELVERARRINWYHSFDLDGGLEIEGQFDLRPHLYRYGIPDDLTGKTVLDVGASNGFFSFNFEKRGAAKVVAVDLPTISEHDFTPALRNEREETFDDETRAEHDVSDLHGGFKLLREVFDSKVQHVGCNIYDLDPSRFGGETFDFVFCGSLLIHLTDPFRALMRLRQMTRERCIMATVYEPSLGDEPNMKFIGVWDGIAWWKPSVKCLEEMMRCAGFKDVKTHHTYDLVSRNGAHVDPTAILHGSV